MSKITKSARGQECQIRIPGVCNGDPETVVFCHLGGGGIGRKQPDLFGAYGCSACHDEVDGRTNRNPNYGRWETDLYFHEAIFRTQQLLLDQGLIKCE